MNYEQSFQLCWLYFHPKQPANTFQVCCYTTVRMSKKIQLLVLPKLLPDKFFYHQYSSNSICLYFKYNAATAFSDHLNPNFRASDNQMNSVEYSIFVVLCRHICTLITLKHSINVFFSIFQYTLMLSAVLGVKP